MEWTSFKRSDWEIIVVAAGKAPHAEVLTSSGRRQLFAAGILEPAADLCRNTNFCLSLGIDRNKLLGKTKF
jgi:hypothetical protein